MINLAQDVYTSRPTLLLLELHGRIEAVPL
jgi:hypothetical protein